MLRQQWEREGQTSFRSLADYLAPVESGLADYLGAFAVTAGARRRGAGSDVRGGPRRLQRASWRRRWPTVWRRRSRSCCTSALAANGATAANEQLTKDDLIAEKYRGIRPAAGYPSCPDHTEKATLWRLLDAEATADIRLTETLRDDAGGVGERACTSRIRRRRISRSIW